MTKTAIEPQTFSKTGSPTSNCSKFATSAWTARPDNRADSSTEPILIFRIGSLGDTVVALPCFHLIAQSFPESRRIVVTNTPVSYKAAPLESVLANSGLIDGVIRFHPGTRSLREIMELRRDIRNTGARTLIYLSPRKLLGLMRDVTFFRWCGVTRIIGAPFAYDLRRARADRSGIVEREAERLARCLAPLGLTDVRDPSLWDLRLQPDESASASHFLTLLQGQDFIAMNLGGKVPSKDWGDANWIQLLQLMYRECFEFALIFFGSEDEFSRSDRVAAAWPGKTLNLCGKLSPRQSLALMQHGTVFVGHDSGPMHLASAGGVPCVVMFGNLDPPQRWHPFGEEHRLIHNMGGVLQISPEEVYSAVKSVIGTRRV